MIDSYLARFAKLSRERGGRGGKWTAVTAGGAPHKPLLLLAVLDQFAEGAITGNLVEPSDDLVDAFVLYWSRVVPPPHRGVMALPFFHLKSDSFWHLVPVPGKEAVVSSGVQLGTLTTLRDAVLGARLDDDLYSLLAVTELRERLRAVLLHTYFSAEAQAALTEQGTVNVEAFRYAEALFAQAKHGEKISETAQTVYTKAARWQGFRRLVVGAYQRQCAFCDLRVVTADGHSSVDAAHIVPFSVSRDDNPQNGLALCRLCHWAFDEGMITVRQDLRLRTSPQLRGRGNAAGYLVDLGSKSLRLPADSSLYPGLDRLADHERDVFQKR